MPPEKQKILAIKLRALGDTVLMTASLESLRVAFPSAEIHALVPEKWSEVLKGNLGVHRIWTWNGNVVSKLTRILSLRAQRFDAIICFHASPSSSRLARAIGAPVRSIHFHGLKDENRSSTVEIPGKGVVKPIIERDLDAVRALGKDPGPRKLPQVFVSESEREWASRWISERHLPYPLLILGLGASRSTKQWPIERFARLAALWTGGVLAVGTTAEQKLLEQFSSLSSKEGSRVQAEQSLSVRQLAAILAHASVMAGNDSGPRHLAVAVGTPTVTLFGPEHPYEWHPYPTDRHPYFFVEDLACRQDAAPGLPAWCGLESCETEKLRCMTGIEAEAVLRECERVCRRDK